MSDLQLTIAAATVEVGVAVLVLLAVFVGKPARHRVVVVLGALTPAIVVMAQVTYAQFIAPTPGSMAGAGWVMGFTAYALILIVGVLVSFSPRPANLYGRYLLGFACASASIGLLMLA